MVLVTIVINVNNYTYKKMNMFIVHTHNFYWKKASSYSNLIIRIRILRSHLRSYQFKIEFQLSQFQLINILILLKIAIPIKF